MKFYVLLLSILVLQACNSTKQSVMDNTAPKGTYNFDLSNSESEPTNAPLQITFDMDNSKISGYSGCNRFFGNFMMTDSELQLTPLATTRKACKGDVSKIESRVLEALNNTNSYKFKKTSKSEVIEFYNDNELLITATKTVPENMVR